MLSRKLNILSLALGLGLAQFALAASDLTINGGEGAVNPLADMSVAGATQRTSTNSYTVRFRASCFRTNLRGVANPIAPNSTVIMSGKMTIDNGTTQNFSVRFPASAVLGTAAAATQTNSLSGFTLPAGSVAAYSGNTVTLKMPSSVVNTVDPVTAEIHVAQQRFQVSNVSFTQEAGATDAKGQYCFIGSCSFYAYNGVLSSSAINVNQSSDGKTYDIETGFPGQEGYCGGFHSPLMVFLDKEIPKFDNVVDFNMNGSDKTYWPEKNHPGYFVALPNKQGKVTSNEELFGESDDYKNGFAKLAIYDLNKDGVIDSKDPVFKKLVLWKDKSGKGAYSKKDTIPLASMVKSINLKYESMIHAVSEKVEFRQKSTIVLKDPKKYPNAYIVDVWFQPYTSALTAN
ncbi:hypothetical protein CIK05_04830 [Bdellovibrio sp. qaytius]|nr:hypothetical protein CIK05_04830 [Bdellovibrio sp. qaytius]